MSDKNVHTRVVKSQGATLPHLVQAEKSPQGLNLPPISLSKETKDQLDIISKQMQSAANEMAESESPSLKVDEEKTVDPIFSEMQSPPDVSVASIAIRKRIESKLAPLRIDDLFISGEIHQSVEIIEGKLRVVFRTLRSSEDLYIKKKLSEVKTEVFRYAEDRMLLMYISAHLVEVNGTKYADLSDATGKISDKNFDTRFQQVSNLPQVLIERIWVNLRWFEDRVRQALSPDFLGNG
jgi:hypothetical protein